jgi:hypothetical protein
MFQSSIDRRRGHIRRIVLTKMFGDEIVKFSIDRVDEIFDTSLLTPHT